VFYVEQDVERNGIRVYACKVEAGIFIGVLVKIGVVMGVCRCEGWNSGFLSFAINTGDFYGDAVYAVESVWVSACNVQADTYGGEDGLELVGFERASTGKEVGEVAGAYACFAGDSAQGFAG